MKGKKIVVLASGGGSNAQAIVDHLHTYTDHRVVAIGSNSSNAGVFARAEALCIPSFISPNNTMIEAIAKITDTQQVDGIVLAGYLRKIPEDLIHQFEDAILNIHPALLPKYGGKGMYGMHVHTAVYAAKESESGMTIHYVNADYDKGKIICQARVVLSEADDPPAIAAKVLRLEHFHYPRVVDVWLTGLNPPV